MCGLSLDFVVLFFLLSNVRHYIKQTFLAALQSLGRMSQKQERLDKRGNGPISINSRFG